MEKITAIEDYRRRKAAESLAEAWRERLGEDYGVDLGLPAVSDKSLFFLAERNPRSDQAFFALIIAVLEPAANVPFSRLNRVEQARVMDIQLYLADRIRFEIMRRLSWLTDYSGRSATMVQMVFDFPQMQYQDLEIPPQLAFSHPGYAEFSRLIAREKGVYVRKLVPEALIAFQARLES